MLHLLNPIIIFVLFLASVPVYLVQSQLDENEHELCTWGGCTGDPGKPTTRRMTPGEWCQRLARKCKPAYPGGPLTDPVYKHTQTCDQKIIKITCLCTSDDSFRMSGCIDLHAISIEEFYKSPPTYNLEDPRVKHGVCVNNAITPGATYMNAEIGEVDRCTTNLDEPGHRYRCCKRGAGITELCS